MTLAQEESASNSSHVREAELIPGETGEQMRCNASVSQVPLGKPSGLLSQTPEALARGLQDYPTIKPSLPGSSDLALDGLHADVATTPVDSNCLRLRRYLIDSMGSMSEEVLRVLFLDSGHRLIADEQLRQGSVQNVNFRPRTIFLRAMKHDATGLIIVHNHPSGDPTPSATDLEVTRELADIGRTLDIEVIDHLVVTSIHARSVTEPGIESRLRQQARDYVLRDSGSDFSGRRQEEPSRSLDRARTLYRQRKLRRDLIGSTELFGEPAWDMLIELFIHEGEGKKLSTTALCHGSSIPPSSALRLINRLCVAQLVVRVADPRDGRRHFVELAPTTAQHLHSYFNAEDW
jgi:DNA repair protein RadC